MPVPSGTGDSAYGRRRRSAFSLPAECAPRDSSAEFARGEPGGGGPPCAAIETVGKTARIALGGVRIVAGTHRAAGPGDDHQPVRRRQPGANPAAIYGLRLFGIRTVLIGADLFRLHGARPRPGAAGGAADPRQSTPPRCWRCWRNKQLSPERARPLALISGLNTVLAVTAYLASRRSRS